MNLIEALKTGRRIRPDWSDGEWEDPKDCTFRRDEVLFDRWEVETEAKPRLLAWVCTGRFSLRFGEIRMCPEGTYVPGDGTWTRLPHLDEPEAP